MDHPNSQGSFCLHVSYNDSRSCTSEMFLIEMFSAAPGEITFTKRELRFNFCYTTAYLTLYFVFFFPICISFLPVAQVSQLNQSVHSSLSHTEIHVAEQGIADLVKYRYTNSHRNQHKKRQKTK